MVLSLFSNLSLRFSMRATAESTSAVEVTFAGVVELSAGEVPASEPSLLSTLSASPSSLLPSPSPSYHIG